MTHAATNPQDDQDPNAAGGSPSRILVGADDDGRRLDRYLQALVPSASFALVQKLIRKGAVRVDKKRVKADQRLSAGAEIFLPQSLAVRPVETPQCLNQPSCGPMEEKWLDQLRRSLIEDKGDLVVFNKPAGLAVQGGSKTPVHLDALLRFFADTNNRLPKLVHRLDRDTSGVLVTARGGLAKTLTRQFATRETQKLYWSLCWGCPKAEQGRIDAPLLKRGGQGSGMDQERVVVDFDNGQVAVSDYRVLATGRLSDQADPNNDADTDAFAFAAAATGPRISLIEWRPLTGRTHQLRVHAAHLGNAILGDPKYGQPPRFGGVVGPNIELLRSAGMQLHAASLSIRVDGNQRTFTAPMPDMMNRLLALAGIEPASITSDTALWVKGMRTGKFAFPNSVKVG